MIRHTDRSRRDVRMGLRPRGVPALAFHVGRVGLASLFVLGGVDKIMRPGVAIDAMEAVGLPLPSVLIGAVIAIELGFGLVVAAGGAAAGRRFVAFAAVVLMAHTVAVNALFHPFWAIEGSLARVELSLFAKNVAVAGGLLMVAAFYGGRREGG